MKITKRKKRAMRYVPVMDRLVAKFSRLYRAARVKLHLKGKTLKVGRFS